MKWTAVPNAKVYYVYVYYDGEMTYPYFSDEGTVEYGTTSDLSIEIPAYAFRSKGTYSIQVVASGPDYDSATGYLDVNVCVPNTASVFTINSYSNKVWEPYTESLDIRVSLDFEAENVVLIMDNGRKIFELDNLWNNEYGKALTLTKSDANMIHTFTVSYTEKNCANPGNKSCSHDLIYNAKHERAGENLSISFYCMEPNPDKGKVMSVLVNEGLKGYSVIPNSATAKESVTIKKNDYFFQGNGTFTVDGIKWMLVEYCFEEYFVVWDEQAVIFFGSEDYVFNTEWNFEGNRPYPTGTRPSVTIKTLYGVNPENIYITILPISPDYYDKKLFPNYSYIENDTFTPFQITDGLFECVVDPLEKDGLYILELEVMNHREYKTIVIGKTIDPKTIHINQPSIYIQNQPVLHELSDLYNIDINTGSIGRVNDKSELKVLSITGNKYYVEFKDLESNETRYGYIDRAFELDEYTKNMRRNPYIKGYMIISEDVMYGEAEEMKELNYKDTEANFYKLIRNLGGPSAERTPLREATVDRLKNYINEIANNSTYQSITYIGIFAHGNEEGFALIDEKHGIDAYNAGGISYKDLADWLSEIKGQVILILLPCHSGAIEKIWKQGFFNEQRFTILAAAASDQPAVSYPRKLPFWAAEGDLFLYRLLNLYAGEKMTLGAVRDSLKGFDTDYGFQTPVYLGLNDDVTVFYPNDYYK